METFLSLLVFCFDFGDKTCRLLNIILGVGDESRNLELRAELLKMSALSDSTCSMSISKFLLDGFRVLIGDVGMDLMFGKKPLFISFLNHVVLRNAFLGGLRCIELLTPPFSSCFVVILLLQLLQLISQ